MEPSPIEVSISQTHYSYDSASSLGDDDSDEQSASAFTEFYTYDFIMILELCQNLNIDYLPITWQPALDALGSGGQAEIQQSLISIALSFAFSRVKPLLRSGMAGRKAYQALASQIQILANPVIREHENIITLIGVCWDIRPKDTCIKHATMSKEGARANIERFDAIQDVPSCPWTVWPVLVYAKTKYGDLTCFSRSSAGKDLTVAQKLKLCKDMARGLRDMHYARIVHRDIKPHNILIFEDDFGDYVAKISDLGCSVLMNDNEGFVDMPLSEPWNAPEWHHRRHNFSDIIAMDIYSLGLVCLWFFLRSELLELGILFEAASPSECARLESLKNQDEILSVAHDIIEHSPGMSSSERRDLRETFVCCLALNPADRHLFLDVDGLTELDEKTVILMQRKAKSESAVSSDAGAQSFSLAERITSFYEADYRLREFIAFCLKLRLYNHKYERHTSVENSRNIVLQLSVCLRLGFGLPRNPCQAEELLDESGISHDNLLLEVRKTKKSVHRLYHKVVKKLYDNDHFDPIGFGDFYREHNVLDDAQSRLEVEILQVTLELGDDNNLAMLLKDQLSSISEFKAQWEKAGYLIEQMVETRKRTEGQSAPATLLDLDHLANIYWAQERWDDAERLQLSVIEKQKTILDEDSLSILNTMGNLASTYYSQDRYDEAEALQSHILSMRMQILGDEHPSTLKTMSALAATYWLQEKFEEAQGLGERAMNTSRRVLGEEHSETLYHVGNLAATYRDEGRLEEALCLEVSIKETSERILGSEHTDTLESMMNVASLYRNMDRLKEAEMMKLQVLDIRKRKFGKDHVDTLHSMSNLATLYSEQKRYHEAETLEIEVLESYKRTKGLDHHLTLGCMIMLASTYREQARLEESRNLYMTALQSYRKELDEADQHIVITMLNIGKTYFLQKDYTEAEQWALLGAELGKGTKDSMEMTSAICKTFLTEIYKERNETDRAISLLKEVVREYIEMLGTENLRTKEKIELLREWTES